MLFYGMQQTLLSLDVFNWCSSLGWWWLWCLSHLCFMTHPNLSLSLSLFLPLYPSSTSPILLSHVLSISSSPLLLYDIISPPFITSSRFRHPSIHPSSILPPATLLPGCCDGWCVVGWVQFGCGRYCCFSWPLHLLASCWGSSSRGIWFFLII